jgi:Mrp family chromosome partitioning ATPase
VILDSAPLLAVSDAAGLSRHVDGVLVVAQAKRVSLPHLRESLAKLGRVGAPVIGIVLNRAKVDSVVTSEYEYVEPTRVKRRR